MYLGISIGRGSIYSREHNIPSSFRCSAAILASNCHDTEVATTRLLFAGGQGAAEEIVAAAPDRRRARVQARLLQPQPHLHHQTTNLNAPFIIHSALAAMRQFQSLLFLLGALFSISHASDYHEQLVLRPLQPSLLLASFNFQSNTTVSSFEQQNFRYFPRSLGQILQHANTRELHLRFSLGRWDAESWGARPWGGAREGGTGVELWAWVEAETDEEYVYPSRNENIANRCRADGRWLTLTNALSGLFCASLNFIDSTRTIRPVMSFDPVGNHPISTAENLHLLHGTLPREVVCTENLTPFLKLLPCKGKAGISSLLDGHKLFDASWQSMSIDVQPICPSAGGECQLQITQTIDMVLDIQRSKRPRGMPCSQLLRLHS